MRKFKYLIHTLLRKNNAFKYAFYPGLGDPASNLWICGADVESFNNPGVHDGDMRCRTRPPDLRESKITSSAAGFLENLRPLAEAFEDIQVEPEEFVEVGDELVVVVHTTARGQGSGISVDNRIAHVWTLRDGKANHFGVYVDEGAGP